MPKQQDMQTQQLFDSDKKNRYAKYIDRREKLIKMKQDELEKQRQAQVTNECTFKPQILSRPKSSNNFGKS